MTAKRKWKPNVDTNRCVDWGDGWTYYAQSKTNTAPNALDALREFTKELQHYSGATCYEAEGQEGRDPDNCQKCRLEDIAEEIARHYSPLPRNPRRRNESLAEL